MSIRLDFDEKLFALSTTSKACFEYLVVDDVNIKTIMFNTDI